MLGDEGVGTRRSVGHGADVALVVMAEMGERSDTPESRSTLLTTMQLRRVTTTAQLGTVIPDSKDSWYAAEGYDGLYVLADTRPEGTIEDRAVKIDGSVVVPRFNGIFYQPTAELGTLFLCTNGSVERRDNLGKVVWSNKPGDAIALVVSTTGLKSHVPKLISAYRDGTVTTVDLLTGTELSRFSRAGREPAMMAATPDGRLLAITWRRRPGSRRVGGSQHRCSERTAVGKASDGDLARHVHARRTAAHCRWHRRSYRGH